jgi:preprotein translocase SecF subunit
VGPRVGQELRSKATWAVLIALGLIGGYVAIRFDIKFSTGGVVALIHDILAVLAAFSLLGREISIPVIAALLTIGGFSINDTVVVFDRIREQSRMRIGHRLSDVIDLAVNQTLSRTIITSLTVMMTALALLFFGGEVLFDFALAMTVGLLSGSYSTVFIASAIALDFNPNARIEAPPAISQV